MKGKAVMKIKTSSVTEYTRETVVEANGSDYIVEFILTRHSYDFKVWKKDATEGEMTHEEIAQAFGVEEETLGDLMTDLDFLSWESEKASA